MTVILHYEKVDRCKDRPENSRVESTFSMRYGLQTSLLEQKMTVKSLVNVCVSVIRGLLWIFRRCGGSAFNF